MLKRYEALKTVRFDEEQAIADFVEGNYYNADKEESFAVSEFGETVVLTQEQFAEIFRQVRISRAGNKAKKKYRKKKTTQLYITFFEDTDKDIIEHLNTFTASPEERLGGRMGKSEYIRKLIRADISKKS